MKGYCFLAGIMVKKLYVADERLGIQVLRTKEEQFNEWLDQLFRLYRDRLLHYAQMILLNQEDAEDVVQQTFVWLSEKKRKIGNPEDEAVWHYLSVMTRHYAINRIREKKRFCNELPEKTGKDPLEEIEPGPTHLDTAMDQLSERARDMLLLHYSDGFTVNEIAELYEMKVPAVRQALLRAKRALKENLRELEK